MNKQIYRDIVSFVPLAVGFILALCFVGLPLIVFGGMAINIMLEGHILGGLGALLLACFGEMVWMSILGI